MTRLYFFSMYYLCAVALLHEAGGLKPPAYVWLSTAGMALFLLASLSIACGFQRYVAIFSLFLGQLLFFLYHMDFSTWHAALTRAMAMPVLFTVIPLLTLPVQHGGYLPAMQSYLAGRWQKPLRLFWLLSGLHLWLTIALNIASLPTMQNLLGESRLPRRFLIRLYTTGYASSMVFSPYDGMVNMVLLLTGVRYAAYFPAAAGMMLLIMLIGALLFRREGGLPAPATEATPPCPRAGRRVGELVLHIGALIGLVFVGDRLMHLSNQLYVISLLIVCYSLFWLGLLQKWPVLARELPVYHSRLLGSKNFLPLIIAAAFLGTILAATPLKGLLEQLLPALQTLPLYNVIQLMILLTIALSLCGINMTVPVTALALTVDPATLGLTPPAFALSLLCCWYIAMSISPFVPFAAVLAETVAATPRQVSWQQNRRFALLMFFLAPAYIVLANKML